MKSLQLSKPHCIIVIGVPGSGKTTFAEKFAETFHAPFVNPLAFTDQLGLETTSETAEMIADKLLDIVLPSQQTIIYEPLSGSRTERVALARRVRGAGYEPLLVWVQTDLPAAKQRMTRSTRTTPPLLSDAEFETRLKRFTPPHASEKFIVVSGMRTYASQVKPLLKRLAENARPLPSPQVPQRLDPSPIRPSEGRRTVKIL